MGTMRFMSISKDPRKSPKIFSFDSSPGRAIGQALGAGLWDEQSYTSKVVEVRPDETVYEVYMKRRELESQPGPHELQLVGMITHRPAI